MKLGESQQFLAYKLKKLQTERVILKIKDPNNKQIKHKIQDIQGCFESYYKNLYTKKSSKVDSDVDTLLNSLKLPVISDEQNTTLLAKITSKSWKAQ